MAEWYSPLSGTGLGDWSQQDLAQDWSCCPLGAHSHLSPEDSPTESGSEPWPGMGKSPGQYPLPQESLWAPATSKR